MVQERKDRLMAYRIDIGLQVQREAGTRAAASYLATYGVPMKVSVRVLSTPSKRAANGYDKQPFWFDIVRASGTSYGAHPDVY